MSLYTELKRRHVLKVGAAYVVVAWIAVQVASIAFPAFDAPGWVLRVFILVAMLGFPVAAVMAWVLEMTPEGMRVEPAPVGNKRVFGIAAGLAALAVAWYFVGQPALRRGQEARTAQAASAAQAPVAPASTAPAARSIAVLPFVNMSADADNAFFADGISEELLNVLVRVPGLEVASRTSSFAYRDRTALGATQIARELKVAHVLEGSVRKSGNRVRITAQLIDAVNDRHLWSETYDRELDDIFAIQDEIAKAIAVALRGKLDAAQAKASVSVQADTQNMQAYDLYLKARGLFIERRELPEVVRLYERAIELDPSFARAHEGLAAVSAVMPGWGYDDRDYIALGERAADLALELDPSLSMPWAAKAELMKVNWPIDYALQLEQLDKALAADAHNTTAVFWKGIVWIELGFFDRAIAQLDRCLAMEPKYHNCRSHKAMALALRGDEAAALVEFERLLAADAYMSRSDHFIVPLVRQGDRTGAWLLLALNGVEPELRRAIMAAIDRPGPPTPATRALVARALADPERSIDFKVLGQARPHLWIGDLEAFDAKVDARLGAILAWERHPPAFRNSPAMKRALVDSGVVAYWRAHGFPPQCRAVGRDDFHCD